jgi:hypothetical protein
VPPSPATRTATSPPPCLSCTLPSSWPRTTEQARHHPRAGPLHPVQPDRDAGFAAYLPDGPPTGAAGPARSPCLPPGPPVRRLLRLRSHQRVPRPPRRPVRRRRARDRLRGNRRELRRRRPAGLRGYAFGLLATVQATVQAADDLTARMLPALGGLALAAREPTGGRPWESAQAAPITSGHPRESRPQSG